MKQSTTLIWIAIFLAGCVSTRQPVKTPYLQRLSATIQKDPSDARALSDRGFAYAMIGEEHRALADFHRALQLEPENPTIHWSYGWALFNLSRYHAALQEWNTAIEGQRERPWWAEHTLALGHWAAGDKVEALGFYDKAAKLNPDRFSTRDNLLKYTSFWTTKEREVIQQVFDAWDRAFTEKD